MTDDLAGMLIYTLFQRLLVEAEKGKVKRWS